MRLDLREIGAVVYEILIEGGPIQYPIREIAGFKAAVLHELRLDRIDLQHNGAALDEQVALVCKQECIGVETCRQEIGIGVYSCVHDGGAASGQRAVGRGES